MCISQIAALHEAVPPKLYGGAEQLVSLAILDVQPAAGPVRDHAAWATHLPELQPMFKTYCSVPVVSIGRCLNHRDRGAVLVARCDVKSGLRSHP
jgi:hypothetical protein